MRNRSKLFLASSMFAAGALFAAPVLAQNAAPPPPTESQQNPATTPNTNPTTTPSPNTNSNRMSQDLTGQAIYNSSGREIGTVSSMMVDTDGNQVAIVNVEKYLGMGGKKVEFPVSSLTARSNGGYTTSLSAAKIKKLPEYKPGG
jgi:sporulation protein YlmC with PRC-barrel domain